jgi:hypothetical protein
MPKAAGHAGLLTRWSSPVVPLLGEEIRLFQAPSRPPPPLPAVCARRDA